jgi:DNA (cytosine-5)-methyltransferase 1
MTRHRSARGPGAHSTQGSAVWTPAVPDRGDITRIDQAFVDPAHVITVGFSCRDMSDAGRRAGIEKGTLGGLWTRVVAAVRVLRRALVMDNLAAHRWTGSRLHGLHRVLSDLAEAGYDGALA